MFRPEIRLIQLRADHRRLLRSTSYIESYVVLARPHLERRHALRCSNIAPKSSSFRIPRGGKLGRRRALTGGQINKRTAPEMRRGRGGLEADVKRQAGLFWRPSPCSSDLQRAPRALGESAPSRRALQVASIIVRIRASKGLSIAKAPLHSCAICTSPSASPPQNTSRRPPLDRALLWLFCRSP